MVVQEDDVVIDKAGWFDSKFNQLIRETKFQDETRVTSVKVGRC